MWIYDLQSDRHHKNICLACLLTSFDLMVWRLILISSFSYIKRKFDSCWIIIIYLFKTIIRALLLIKMKFYHGKQWIWFLISIQFALYENVITIIFILICMMAYHIKKRCDLQERSVIISLNIKLCWFDLKPTNYSITRLPSYQYISWKVHAPIS